MKRYVLDTGPLAAFLLGRAQAVATINPWLANREVVTSIIVYGEVEEYIKQMPNYGTLHAILIRQLEEIKPLSITRHIMGRSLCEMTHQPGACRQYGSYGNIVSV